MPPEPARVTAARCRGALTAAVATAGTIDLTGMPTLVRRFLVEDLPLLLEVLHNTGSVEQHDADHLSPQDQIVEAPRTPGRLAELVDLARLVLAAEDAPDPGLWQLRKRDLDAAWRRYCPHRTRLIAEAAVRELAGTSRCRTRTEGQPAVPWLAPEWEVDS